MLMLIVQFDVVFLATYFVVARAQPPHPKRLVFAALLGGLLLAAVGLPFMLKAPIYGGIVVVLASTLVGIMPAVDAVRLEFLDRKRYFLVVALWTIPLLALATYLMIKLPSGKLTLEQIHSLLPLSVVSLAAIPVVIYRDLKEWTLASLGGRIVSAVFTAVLLYLLVVSVIQVYWRVRTLF